MKLEVLLSSVRGDRWETPERSVGNCGNLWMHGRLEGNLQFIGYRVIASVAWEEELR